MGGKKEAIYIAKDKEDERPYTNVSNRPLE